MHLLQSNMGIAVAIFLNANDFKRSGKGLNANNFPQCEQMPKTAIFHRSFTRDLYVFSRQFTPHSNDPSRNQIALNFNIFMF